MATFALKVSIDDSKYIIRGIDKKSSKKEILCILTKYKNKDQLPELQSALSKLNGSVGTIKIKKERKVEESVKDHYGVSKVSNRRKRSAINEAKNSLYGDRCTDRLIFSNDEQQMINLSKGKSSGVKASENIKNRKRVLISRSQSLNEKDRQQGKYSLRARPKSFGAFDANKPMKTDCPHQLIKNGNITIQRTCKMKVENQMEGVGEDEKDDGTSTTENTQRIQNTEFKIKSRKHYDLKSKRLKTQLQQNKLQNWFGSLKRNSLAYFLEGFETHNSNDLKRLPAAEKIAEAEESNDSVCKCDEVDELDCVKSSDYVENTEYADAETDSGLPSLEYESSLDTLSRDERVSLEQSCDEGRAKDSQNDSGFDSNSFNERKITEIASTDSLNQFKGASSSCEANQFESLITERENFSEGSHMSNDDYIENAIIKERKTELKQDGLESTRLDEKESDLFWQVKNTMDKISKTDENILHCELLISQLEFQLETLSENFDAIEDFDLELEETKMISDLKETEEFLKAVTTLSQYQREAQSEIMEELLHIDVKMKERQTRLQSLEKKLIRQQFKSVPRHLNASREKNLYVKEVISSIKNDADNCYLYDNHDNAISLV